MLRPPLGYVVPAPGYPGPSRLHLLHAHFDEHLIDMPFPMRLWPTSAKLSGDERAERMAPPADALIGYDDPALEQQLLDAR
jgi:hypothetical protein